MTNANFVRTLATNATLVIVKKTLNGMRTVKKTNNLNKQTNKCLQKERMINLDVCEGCENSDTAFSGNCKGSVPASNCQIVSFPMIHNIFIHQGTKV